MSREMFELKKSVIYAIYCPGFGDLPFGAIYDGAQARQICDALNEGIIAMDKIESIGPDFLKVALQIIQELKT